MNKTTFQAIRAAAITLYTLALCSAASASPFEVHGKVVYVDDGDTVVMLVDGRSHMKVRLSSIDAPETSHTKKEAGRIGQPFSNNSAKYLATLVKGREVAARCFETDRYGRDVCELFVDGRSVNKAMVEQGWAWANRAAHGRYLRDRSLASTEAAARASGSGLWAGVNPVAPWEWRDVCWKQGKC
jgi:micrococcal nuclease